MREAISAKYNFLTTDIQQKNLNVFNMVVHVANYNGSAYCKLSPCFHFKSPQLQ